jgi:hypothetical protein
LDKKFYNITSQIQYHTMTSQKQISLFTEEQSTSLVEASLANPTQVQESDLAKKMRDTSGLRCLEQFGKFNQVGLWARTFADLLIGTGDWYSTRCKLTWKLKATKSSRFYFQLVPLTHHTDETASGSWLLKTPTRMDGEVSSGKKNAVSGNSGTLAQEIMSSYEPTMKKLGLLPTPTAMDSSNATVNMKSTQVKKGSMHSVTLTRALAMGMLPTPLASDCGEKVTGLENQMSLTKMIRQGLLPTPNSFDLNTARSQETLEKAKQRHKEKGVVLQNSLRQMDGQGFQLNPLFVAEMMGFPKNWTALPFLNGETKASKPTETQ